MVGHRRNQKTCKRGRSGLAPLELVLSLPIMLFVMALMINFGNVAAWKVRAQTNARYSLWRNLMTRTGTHDPNPVNWRVPDATLGNSGGSAVDEIDALWDDQPDPNTPVVRGPAVVAPQTGDTIRVVRDLEMRGGVRSGNARLERDFPMLRSMLRNNGQFELDPHQSAFDNRWQFHTLGFGTNRAPRARGGVDRDGNNQSGWYILEPHQLPAPVPQLEMQLRTAHQNLMANPLKADLNVLDRDEEYRELARMVGPRDFHPQPNTSQCGANAISVRDNLVRRTEHLAYTMARAHITAHEREIQRIEDEIEDLKSADPPPRDLAQQIQALEAERQVHLNQIGIYQDFIDNLSDFAKP